MLKLNNTIKVMVPTKDNDGKAIDYMKLVQGVTNLAGGSTMYSAQGLWVSDNKTYNDSNKLVEFNVNDEDAYNTLALAMEAIVYPLLHEGGHQRAVWLQVNGTTFILDKGTVGETLEVAKALTVEALAIEKYRTDHM